MSRVEGMGRGVRGSGMNEGELNLKGEEANYDRRGAEFERRRAEFERIRVDYDPRGVKFERRKLTERIHSDTIRSESTGSGLVFKTAEIVLGPHILQLGVVLEGVDDALSLNGVCTLDVVVIREEELLCSMELPPAANGFLRPVVPPNPNLHVVAMVGIDLLHASNVWRLVGVRRPHQHAVPSCKTIVAP
ncbi:hypothetical protein M5K25_026732 [Dendrobium thyrsiflorum]|uniref:Uncharacterized protein n=1 Tax=Dendrobium thyrsiflorum TaxID=117978 RepID=A0ABD0TY84_DENTH